MTSPSADPEKLVRLALRFLDLSLDLKRMRDDVLYQKEGHTIHYTVDANIFELFVRPWDFRGRSASFHSEDWDILANPSTRLVKESYQKQAAMLAAEYIVSDVLPGQPHPQLLISPWHRVELALRIDKMSKEFQEQALNASPKKLEAQGRMIIEGTKAVEDALAGKSDRAKLTKLRAAMLADFQDYLEDFSESDLPPAMVETRVGMEILAEDNQITPIEQLRHIVESKTVHKMRGLHRKFPDYDETVAASRSKHWFGLLQLECRRRNIGIVNDDQDDERSGRSRAALWSDAQTIALVEAVSEKSGEDRVVFVTADEIVFDTYRREFSQRAQDDSRYSNPFLLRRFRQYAPIFNLQGTNVRFGSTLRNSFDKLNQILEVTLLTLNLSELNKASGESQLRQRERTALRLTDGEQILSSAAHDELIQMLNLSGALNDLKLLQSTIEKWRRLERCAISMSGRTILPRLQDRNVRMQTALTDAGSATSEDTFADYVNLIISEIRNDSARFWLPIAREFVQVWHENGMRTSPRVPISLRLNLNEDGAKLQLTNTFAVRKDDELKTILANAWDKVLGQPALALALGAWSALAVEDWSNADQFADAALELRTIDGHSHPPTADEEEDWAEYRFLAALTNRFRIGAMSPPLSFDGGARVFREFEIANEHLTNCIDYHAKEHSEGPQFVRLCRAYSERAALNLFLCAAFASKVRRTAINVRFKGDQSKIRQADQNFAYSLGYSDHVENLFASKLPGQHSRAALIRAVNDLATCLHLEAHFKSNENEMRQSFIDQLQIQYLSNAASAVVMTHILGMKLADIEGAVLFEKSDIVSRIQRMSFGFKTTTTNPLLRAEVYAYLHLMGFKPAAKQFKILRRQEKMLSNLALDRALFRVLIDPANVWVGPD
ncbi:hypothetical protein [Hyphomonas sp.]|uniref:hypothetical protein n=1 Tax=Hyphomonas sp. TaxID=87 RepID=UPI0025C3022E|nr:hypothetical protein [Hyphomonas sp.]